MEEGYEHQGYDVRAFSITERRLLAHPNKIIKMIFWKERGDRKDFGRRIKQKLSYEKTKKNGINYYYKTVFGEIDKKALSRTKAINEEVKDFSNKKITDRIIDFLERRNFFDEVGNNFKTKKYVIDGSGKRIEIRPIKNFSYKEKLNIDPNIFYLIIKENDKTYETIAKTSFDYNIIQVIIPSIIDNIQNFKIDFVDVIAHEITHLLSIKELGNIHTKLKNMLNDAGKDAKFNKLLDKYFTDNPVSWYEKLLRKNIAKKGKTNRFNMANILWGSLYGTKTGYYTNKEEIRATANAINAIKERFNMTEKEAINYASRRFDGLLLKPITKMLLKKDLKNIKAKDLAMMKKEAKNTFERFGKWLKNL